MKKIEKSAVFDEAVKLQPGQKIICSIEESITHAFDLLCDQEHNLENTVQSAIADTQGVFTWEDFAKAQYLLEKKRFEKRKLMISVFETIVGIGNMDVLMSKGIYMNLNTQAAAVEIFKNGMSCDCEGSDECR